MKNDIKFMFKSWFISFGIIVLITLFTKPEDLSIGLSFAFVVCGLGSIFLSEALKKDLNEEE